MIRIMDKFIKSVPLVVLAGLAVFIWQSGDKEYSNIIAATLCALIVFMLTGLVYTVMSYFKMHIMPAGHYLCVMIGAGLLTFGVLYASLEYFYT